MIWYDLRFESTLKVGTTSSIDGLIWFGHLSHRFCDGMAATLEVSCCHCQWHDIEVVLRMDEMEPLPVIPLCVKTIKDVVSDTIKRQGRESKKSQSHGSKAHACCCARQVAGVLRALRHCGGVDGQVSGDKCDTGDTHWYDHIPSWYILYLDTICICLQLLQVAGHQDCVVVDVPRQRLRHPCRGQDLNGPLGGCKYGQLQHGSDERWLSGRNCLPCLSCFVLLHSSSSSSSTYCIFLLWLKDVNTNWYQQYERYIKIFFLRSWPSSLCPAQPLCFVPPCASMTGFCRIKRWKTCLTCHANAMQWHALSASFHGVAKS